MYYTYYYYYAHSTYLVHSELREASICQWQDSIYNMKHSTEGVFDDYCPHHLNSAITTGRAQQHEAIQYNNYAIYLIIGTVKRN